MREHRAPSHHRRVLPGRQVRAWSRGGTRLLWHLPLLMVVVLLLWPVLALAVQTYAAKVVGVTDGDTLTILRDGQHQQRVRVHGIDTPERGQPFGTRAREFTAALVFGQMVTIRDHGPDRYGHTIADVNLPDGQDLGRELVPPALAWWYRRYSTDRTLETLEAEPRRGLWADPAPSPPWEWRPR